MKANYPAMLRRKGFKPGGRRKYGRYPDGSIREGEAAVVRSLVHLGRRGGTSETTVARRLNAEGIVSASGGPWHAGSIAKLLRRLDLAGLYRVDGEVIESSLEPILDPDIWDQSQALFAARRTMPERRGREPRVPFLLDDPIRVRCGCCGGRMGVRSGAPRIDGTVQASYVCVARERDGTERGCPMRRVPREIVDQAMLAIFTRDLIDERATVREIERARRAVVTDTRRTLVAAERELMRLDAQRALVKRRFRDGDITATEWRTERSEIEEEHEATSAEVDRLRQRVDEISGEDALLAAEQVIVEVVVKIGRLATDSRCADAETLAEIRAAISRVVEEVVIVDTELPVGYLGAIQMALPEHPEVGDTFGAALTLHGIGHNHIGLELVPRRDLALAQNVVIGGEPREFVTPGKTSLSLADNRAFTSQNTRRRPRRTTRSSS